MWSQLTTKYPAGSLPDYRVVRINPATNEYALCGASDVGAFGFTLPKETFCELFDTDPQSPTYGQCLKWNWRRKLIARRWLCVLSYSDIDGVVHDQGIDNRYVLFTVPIEAAAGATIAAGKVCYQASDGMISDTGTVRVGVANSLRSAGPPAIWNVIPD